MPEIPTGPTEPTDPTTPTNPPTGYTDPAVAACCCGYATGCICNPRPSLLRVRFAGGCFLPDFSCPELFAEEFYVPFWRSDGQCCVYQTFVPTVICGYEAFWTITYCPEPFNDPNPDRRITAVLTFRKDGEMTEVLRFCCPHQIGITASEGACFNDCFEDQHLVNCFQRVFPPGHCKLIVGPA